MLLSSADRECQDPLHTTDVERIMGGWMCPASGCVVNYCVMALPVPCNLHEQAHRSVRGVVSGCAQPRRAAPRAIATQALAGVSVPLAARPTA